MDCYTPFYASLPRPNASISSNAPTIKIISKNVFDDMPHDAVIAGEPTTSPPALFADAIVVFFPPVNNEAIVLPSELTALDNAVNCEFPLLHAAFEPLPPDDPAPLPPPCGAEFFPFADAGGCVVVPHVAGEHGNPTSEPLAGEPSAYT